MPTPPIKTNIELGGEKEYRQALSQINGGLRVLSSEMKLTSAQYADNAKGVGALTAKNDVLERQILSQKEKVDTLRAALQQSAQKYGEADSHTQRWQASLNGAETELVNMERELKDNNKSLKDFNDGSKGATQNTKGLGDAVGSLGQKFGITLPENMKTSLNSFMSFDATTLAMVGTFVALSAAIVAATTKLVKMTIEQAKVADDILTTASITGIGTDKLQEYAYAAELMDVSVETLTGSQTKLIRSMGNAQRGTTESIEAFEKLGVAFANTDGSLRNTEEVFWESIDALGRMSNEAERDAVAMQIMGRSARDLNPLILAGSDAMKALGDEAGAAGAVLDEGTLVALGNVDDAMQRWDNTIDTVKKRLAAQLAPSLEKVMTKATGFIESVGKSFEESGIVGSFGSILESVVDLLDPLAAFIELVGPGLKFALDIIAIPLAMFTDTLNAAVGLFEGLFKFDWTRFNTAMGWNTDKGMLSAQGKIYYGNRLPYNTWDAEAGGWVGNGAGANASGDANWRGGMTWVGENGPERVYLPQGSQIQSAQESRLTSGGDTFNITISAASVKEFNDIVRIAQNKRRVARMG